MDRRAGDRGSMVGLRSTWSFDERRRALVSKLSIGQVGGLK